MSVYCGPGNIDHHSDLFTFDDKTQSNVAIWGP